MVKRYNKSILKKLFLSAWLIMLIAKLYGQQLPQYPISYRIFSPFIFNPAIAGSKDFSSIDLLLGKYEKSFSHIVAGNMRIAKTAPRYFSSINAPDFSNIGIGGFYFNGGDNLSKNFGFGVSGSYHIQMDKNAFSFLSLGASAKIISHRYSGENNDKPAVNSVMPDIDLGLYFYSPRLTSGLSVTNLLGNPISDSLGSINNPVSRQVFFQAGFKVVLSKSLDILAEPSLIITDDTFSGEIINMVKPGLKIYTGSFCIGTFLNEFERIPFFLQYKYSKLTIGTYFAIPYHSAFYRKPLLAEFFLGFNLSAFKSGFSRGYHW